MAKEKPSYKDLLEFVETIARLSKDGEPQTALGKNTEDDAEDDEYIMESDDAVDTVNTLITEARGLVEREGK